MAPRDRTQHEPIWEMVGTARPRGVTVLHVTATLQGLGHVTAESVGEVTDDHFLGFFFRTEATNMLKQKEGTPGPNPIRTHFGEMRKRRPLRIGGRPREVAPPDEACTIHARELGLSRVDRCRFCFVPCGSCQALDLKLHRPFQNVYKGEVEIY